MQLYKVRFIAWGWGAHGNIYSDPWRYSLKRGQTSLQAAVHFLDWCFQSREDLHGFWQEIALKAIKI